MPSRSARGETAGEVVVAGWWWVQQMTWSMAASTGCVPLTPGLCAMLRVRRVAKMRIAKHAAAYLWQAVPAGFVHLFTQTSFENSQSSLRARVA